MCSDGFGGDLALVQPRVLDGRVAQLERPLVGALAVEGGEAVVAGVG